MTCQLGSEIRHDHSGVYECLWGGKGIRAAFSGREYDRNSYSAFLEIVGIDPRSLKLVRQIHSSRIIWVDRDDRSDSQEADGIMTHLPNVALGILTADCIPLFIWDPVLKVCGMVHCGWRGLHQGIVQEALHEMSMKFHSKHEDILCGIGPAIRECCYQVGQEFQGYFGPYFMKKSDSSKGQQGYADLVGFLKEQLTQRGILEQHIFDCNICTSCHHDQFFSARREDDPNRRILSVIHIDSE